MLEATAFQAGYEGFDSLRPLSLSRTRSGIQAHVLDADDLLTFVHGDCVPDCHVVSGQMQLVSTRQRIVTGERIREGRDWLV